MIVEFATKTALKEENERLLNTKMRDVTNMLRADISAALTGFVQSHKLRLEFELKGVLLPALPSCENVGPYEDELGVRLPNATALGFFRLFMPSYEKTSPLLLA